MTNRIAVLGSINVDTTYHVARFPEPGETLSAIDKSSAPGGKGANQAVAAARSGAQTTFIGMVGADNEGRFMREALQEDGVDTQFVGNDVRHGTGTALVTLDANGQNDIMVYGGANQAMTTAVLDRTGDLWDQVDFLVSQFETPQEVTLAAFKLAKEHGVTTILNPAPATEILPGWLAVTDVIAPNETESALLTGIEINDEADLVKTADYFRGQGVATTLVTLGSRGAYFNHNGKSGIVPAFKVKAVDTTAAGDTFIGGLVSQLTPSMENLADAITYAQRASSLTVQGMGAMPSIPTRPQVEEALKN